MPYITRCLWVYHEPDPILDGSLGGILGKKKPRVLDGYFTREELGRKKHWCRPVPGSTIRCLIPQPEIDPTKEFAYMWRKVEVTWVPVDENHVKSHTWVRATIGPYTEKEMENRDGWMKLILTKQER